jgi:acetylornithine deacetylase/succinyl-diaminopimelate desuccinylase-like protein
MRRTGGDLPDWDAAARDTVGHLRALIRARTVNPPGNEVLAARYLARQLRAASIPFEVIETGPGRANVIARLVGRGTARPVLLLAHMDVVGVEADRWASDPFSADIRDGYVYGRGAIDDKGMLAANLETMLLLKRHVIDRGGSLARDVIFVATADEEAGGAVGIDWLVSEHADLIAAEYALNEGGRTRIVDGRLAYAAVQTAEKIPHVVAVIARGPGGHAAIPLGGNAIARLGRAVSVIGAHREPVDLTPTTMQFFAALGDVWADPRERQAMVDMASGDPERTRRGEAVLSAIPVLDSLLRTGISPTMLEGGVRPNVIPTEARATLSVRTMPGQPLADTLARLRAAIDDPNVELSVVASSEDAPASSFDTPMFRAIADAIDAVAPGLPVVPYLSTGATDSAKLRRAGVQAYGLLPFPMTDEDEARMHGHDERVSISALGFGVRVVCETLIRIAGDVPNSRGVGPHSGLTRMGSDPTRIWYVVLWCAQREPDSDVRAFDTAASRASKSAVSRLGTARRNGGRTIAADATTPPPRVPTEICAAFAAANPPTFPLIDSALIVCDVPDVIRDQFNPSKWSMTPPSPAA